MLPGVEPSIRRLRRRVALAAWFGLSARWGAIGLACCAVLALLARALFDWPAERAAWLLAPLALVPAAAALAARRRIPSAAAAIAWLDLRGGASGLLVTAFERPDERWRARVAAALEALPEPPPLPIGRAAGRLSLATAFALAALFVPLVRSQPGPPATLFEQMISGMTEQLFALQETVALDEELSRELTDRLASLAQLARQSVGREGLLEALDSLGERMERIAGEAAQAGSLAESALVRAAAEALRDPEGAQELLESALSGLAQSGLLSELPPELVALGARLEGSSLVLPEGVDLAGATLREWSAGLRGELRERMAALGRSGLVELSEVDLSDAAASLAALLEREHVCDEECARGGT